MIKSTICLLITSACLLMFSCQRDVIDDASQVKAEKRITFNSTEELMSIYQSLSDKTKEELIAWTDSQKINSLLKLNVVSDPTIAERPLNFQALFNKNLEFQLGDSVVYYTKGDLYIYPLNNRKEESLYAKSSIRVADQYPQTKDYVISPSHQYEIPNNITIVSGTRFKYVHEVIEHDFQFGPMHVVSEIYLVTKLEWKKNAGWKETGEEYRDIYVSLVGELTCRSCREKISIGHRRSVVNVKGDIYFFLYGVQRTMDQYSPYSASMRGSVSQVVRGISSTYWLDNWY